MSSSRSIKVDEDVHKRLSEICAEMKFREFLRTKRQPTDAGASDVIRFLLDLAAGADPIRREVIREILREKHQSGS